MIFIIRRADDWFGNKASAKKIADNWFNGGVVKPLLLIRCLRLSERGAKEEIYVAGNPLSTVPMPGIRVGYIMDTGKGFRGRGDLMIEEVKIVQYDRLAIDGMVDDKLPVYVLK